MKRLLFLLISAIVFGLMSCSVKNHPADTPDGEELSVSFTVEFPESDRTKAREDYDGFGYYVDQCKLQIWTGDVLFLEKTVPVSHYSAKFENIALKKDQIYDFLFWADNKDGAHYITDTLTKVSVAGIYIGGNDKRDAFYAAVNGKTVSEGFSQVVILRRPFAQLNVITVDIPSLYHQFPNVSQLSSILPDMIGVNVTAPTVFNVKTGEASVPAELSYSSSSIYTTPLRTGDGSRNTLSMDYFFAPSEGTLADVIFTAGHQSSDSTDINYTFTNVPLHRNYRTNIIGSFLTVQSEVTVGIVPMWTATIEKQNE